MEVEVYHISWEPLIMQWNKSNHLMQSIVEKYLNDEAESHTVAEICPLTVRILHNIISLTILLLLLLLYKIITVHAEIRMIIEHRL